MPETGAGGTSPEHLVVGHITKPHGTRGELFVWPLTDRPDDVFAPGSVLLLGDAEGALLPDAPAVMVEGARPFKRGLLVALDGLDHRSAVEPLAQHYLLIPRAALPPLDEGEVLYHELLGCDVVTADGAGVGTVREVYETEPNHLLEVVGDDGRARLVPFAERIVRSVDVGAKRIVIDPPEGLLEI